MNEREFSRRVRACAEGLWRISYAILQSGTDCDDALQEALLRAWRRIGALREERYFETWLTRILINECRRILKQRAGRMQTLPESAADVPQPENRELHDAIMALPVALRIPLTLHYMEGYPIKDVAAMLQMPESTIKWRLHSARKRLRAELGREDGSA